jgi:hypothetical protein
MFDFNTLEMQNDIGAGGLQDVYALTIFGKRCKGTYVDIGCRHPVFHNNTFLLEQYGWKGLAVDLENFTLDWEKYRPNSVYINDDAFSVDYKNKFHDIGLESPIDFLSIDLEVSGHRYGILRQLFETGYEFKCITIEHDAYCHPVEEEKIPQRLFLEEQGYILVRKCEYIEDFWINPKYVSDKKYKILMQDNCGPIEVQPRHFLKSKNYDWTSFYDKINLKNIKDLIL